MNNNFFQLLVAYGVCFLCLLTTGSEAGNESYKSEEVYRYGLLISIRESRTHSPNDAYIGLYEGYQSSLVPTIDQEKQKEMEERMAGRGFSNGTALKWIFVEYRKPEFEPWRDDSELRKQIDDVTSGGARLTLKENYAAITDTWLDENTPGGWFLDRPLPPGKNKFTVREAYTLLRREFGMRSFIHKTLEQDAGDDTIWVHGGEPRGRDLLIALLNHPIIDSVNHYPTYLLKPEVSGLRQEDMIDQETLTHALAEGRRPKITGWSLTSGF